jgi:molecular chaperone Hsp33
MDETPADARILRAMTRDHQVRFAALDASPLWDGVRRGHPQLEAEACGVLVELLSGALLLQSRTFFSERLQLLLKGSGRARAVMADAWPEGDVRGVLDVSPTVAGGPWFLPPGLLQVMRSTRQGQPYQGTLEMVEGPLATQIEAYLQQSEQVQASVTLWCEPSTGEAGGLLVEPLPDCPPDRLSRLVDAVEGLDVVPLWERTPDFLCDWINGGPGADILADTAGRYHCRCSRESLLAALAGFGPGRAEEIFQDGDPVQVLCDYCGRAFGISRSDLQVFRKDGAP